MRIGADNSTTEPGPYPQSRIHPQPAAHTVSQPPAPTRGCPPVRQIGAVQFGRSSRPTKSTKAPRYWQWTASRR